MPPRFVWVTIPAMSKLRQQLDTSINEHELTIPREGDLTGYVIFTQLKKDGPFIYAGWLDAPDDRMALILAKEHYGQDQKCTAIWAAPRHFVGGLRENIDAAQEEVSEPRAYQIFTQKESGDQYMSSIRISASSAAEAIEKAKSEIEGGDELNHLWAIPVVELLQTDPDELIWRNTDQSYRLARGYSKAVREKWEQVRKDRDIDEYEKEDLEETF